jgi:hypothetical protein
LFEVDTVYELGRYNRSEILGAVNERTLYWTGKYTHGTYHSNDNTNPLQINETLKVRFIDQFVMGNLHWLEMDIPRFIKFLEDMKHSEEYYIHSYEEWYHLWRGHTTNLSDYKSVTTCISMHSNDNKVDTSKTVIISTSYRYSYRRAVYIIMDIEKVIRELKRVVELVDIRRYTNTTTASSTLTH